MWNLWASDEIFWITYICRFIFDNVSNKYILSILSIKKNIFLNAGLYTTGFSRENILKNYFLKKLKNIQKFYYKISEEQIELDRINQLSLHVLRMDSSEFEHSTKDEIMPNP